MSEFYSLISNASDRRSKILGEEIFYVNSCIRPLYFGLKKIIWNEISALDKPVNVQAFFSGEELGAAMPSLAPSETLAQRSSRISVNMPPNDA